MSRFFYVTVYLLSINGFCFAQAGWYHYNWGSDYAADKTRLCENTVKNDLAKYYNNPYIGDKYVQFSNRCAQDLYDDISRGNVYTSLEGYEKYVRQVLEAIVMDINISKQITIRFYRSEEYSASITENGFLRLNVGLVGTLKNEAELAMVLGHEVAHFLNEDLIKNYARQMELRYLDPKNIKQVFEAMGAVRDYFWFSREQEAEADRISGLFLKHSSYSPDAGFQVFRAYQRIEMRNQIKWGKQNKNAASHPDPGDRMSRLNNNFDYSISKNKLDFVVDSNRFTALRALCRQESLNIGLNKNHLDNVITLTFSRYLQEPLDQANLAVLIEALRRKLYLGKEQRIAERPFILGEYQTKHIAKDENFAYLNTANPSILNHLEEGFVDVWREEMDLLKAADLCDQSVTEFTSNIEAYMYFKEKAKEINAKIAGHYKYFGQLPDFSDADAYVKSNTVFSTNDYLADGNKREVFTKDLFVIVPYESAQLINLLGYGLMSEFAKAHLAQLAATKERVPGDVISSYDLPFDDQHLLTSLLNLINVYVKPAYGSAMRKTNTDWLQASPEIYSFFKRNKIRNLYVCRTNIMRRKEDRYLMSEFFRFSLPDKKSASMARIRTRSSFIFEENSYPNYEAMARKFNRFRKAPDNK